MEEGDIVIFENEVFTCWRNGQRAQYAESATRIIQPWPDDCINVSLMQRQIDTLIGALAIR